MIDDKWKEVIEIDCFFFLKHGDIIKADDVRHMLKLERNLLHYFGLFSFSIFFLFKTLFYLRFNNRVWEKREKITNKLGRRGKVIDWLYSDNKNTDLSVNKF